MSGATLTILGATGYSGRLCAAEAARQGLPLRLAGRRREALKKLAAELGGAEVTVADVSSSGSLRELAAGTSVLLSAVGPYETLGRPVVQAAIEAGTAYADISGEVSFLRWVYDQDDRAREAGAALVPGVGFDGVGELAAALAAGRLAARTTEGIDEARVAYATRGVMVSRGTARSALGVLRQGNLVYRDGAVTREAAGSRVWDVDFPLPFGRRSTVSAPLPEGLTLGRSLGATTARSYLAVPLGRLVSGMALPAGAAARLAAHTPAWSLIDSAVSRLPEGPAVGRRERSSAAILAEVRAGDEVQQAWVQLRDIYGSTARVAVAYAKRLLEGEVAPGVQTPAQAADPHEVLREIGASYTC